MATSVYAASSIHSKSTLSKKYDVDASAVFQGSGNFGGGTEDAEVSGLAALTQSFTVGIGRLDLPYSFFHTLKFWVVPFFVIVNCVGTPLMELNKLSYIAGTIFSAINYIVVWLPSQAPFMVRLSVCVAIIVLYVSFVLFILWLLRSYRQSNCPSFFHVCIFLVVSRIALPVFGTFVAHLFASSMYGVIFLQDKRSESIAFLLCSIPLVIIHILATIFECSVYNATPIIRKNDKSQLWFAYSRMDWQTIVAFFVQIILTYACKLIPNPSGLYVYWVLITVMYLVMGFYVIIWIPFIYPLCNVLMIFTCFSMPFCAALPIVAYHAMPYLNYALIGVIVMLIVMFFVTRAILGARMKKIMVNFATLQNCDEDGENVDSMTAAMMQINPTRRVDFEKLNLKNDKEMSLYLRVGFLFNQQEVVNGLFIKWATDQSAKADLILSACQVSYAVQAESRLMTTLEQNCQKMGGAPYNTKSFVLLFNHLRQEMLTQLNKPLLEATEKAKKADHVLQVTLSEFWSSVLKQRKDSLCLSVPRIANDMSNAEHAFQQLMRDYPRSPTVYREASIFYHKSLGDHHRSLMLQRSTNKVRSQMYADCASASSDTLSSFSNVDSEFKDRMEPWLAAQETIQARSSVSKVCLFVALLIIALFLFMTPVIILGLCMIAIEKFQLVLMPIQTVGDIMYDLSRIPQLARRMQLQVNNEVRKPPPSVGDPINSLTEFTDAAAINRSLTQYHESLSANLKEFYNLCFNDVIYDICKADSVTVVTGNGQIKSTIYDTLVEYVENLGQMLSPANAFQWAKANETAQLQYLFQNFNSLYFQVDSLLNVLVTEIYEYGQSFDRLWLASVLWTWVATVVFIVPCMIISLLVMRKEIRSNLKLLCYLPKSDIAQLRWSTKSKQSLVQTGPLNTTLTARSDSSTSTCSMQAKATEMVETFATVAKQRTGAIGTFTASIVGFFLFTCVMTTICVSVFQLSMGNVVHLSNAYVNSIEVSSLAVGSFVWTQELWTEYPMLFSKDELRQYSGSFGQTFQRRFNDFLYSNNNHTEPALLLGDDIVDLLVVSNTSQEVIVSQYEPLDGILHDVYGNMSSEIQAHFLNQISSLSLTGSTSFSYKDDFVYHYEHLLFGHVDPSLLEMCDFFRVKSEDLNRGRIHQLVFIYVVTVVPQVIFFLAVVISEFRKLLLYLTTTKRLLQLIPPETLLKSQTVVRWLSGTSTKQNRVDAGESVDVKISGEFAIEYSKCGLLVMDDHARIVRANSPALMLLKLSDDEVIGRKYTTLLDGIIMDANKGSIVHNIKKQIKSMKEGYSRSNRCVTNVAIFSTNGELSHVSFILTGQTDENYGDFEEEPGFATPVHSFTCAIIDRTTEKCQESMIEAEKKKSANLMRSVIPECVSERLKHSTDEAFEASRVSVVVCSIGNWGKLISEQSSSVLVGLLSAFFSEIDKIIEEDWKDAVKVKSMGPLYVIAVGLFSDSSINTAQIATDLAFAIIEIAEHVSKTIEMEFQVGIGINTGGPVGGGIVGQLRPTFEVFGDAIEVAMRMVFNIVSGSVQITENTYDDIKFLKYNIKETSEMKVRGKGQYKIYTVTPADNIVL